MKKLMILAAMVAGFALPDAKAQTVNGVRLTDINANYMQVKEIKRTFAQKVFVSVEYGQIADDLNKTCIKDDLGKKMEFDSALDFVNKAKSYGYELFQVFSEREWKSDSNAVYVLKRK
ncbi:hypothetical protein [Pedobacter sp. N23S346]|uniref:hypothetical protein n=1 Tax=Pedobacter sp. N23S346 TaxID=3402750 RepID=UPI003AC32E67